MNTPDPHDRLEALIDHALQDLPPRKAPATLEQRIFAALARTSVQPWWRKDFMHWPVAARILFLVVAASVIRFVIGAPAWVRESSLVELPPAVSWVETTLSALVFVADHLPTFVVYGGLAALATLYATFFGISAITYRSLFTHRL